MQILNMKLKEEYPTGKPRSRWERCHTEERREGRKEGRKEGRNLRRRGSSGRRDRERLCC
jgi:hypothetical protein